MESVKDTTSDVADTEDLPSDFFDDFTKDEFMEGLSVIDECWDDGGAGQKRESHSKITEVLDSVEDLRQLIGENNDSPGTRKPKRRTYPIIANPKYKWRNPNLPSPEHTFKPGSRRDPNKTNEAIKKDKEVKVQQFLAKSLESSDDLRPPGTELDDYYEEEKPKKEPSHTEKEESKQQVRTSKEHSQSPQRTKYRPRVRHSPPPKRSFHQRSPRPRFSPRGSPRRHVRNQSPPLFRQRPPVRKPSPFKSGRRNYSPQRRSPLRYSPSRRSPIRHSPSRRSPRRRQQRSRSPRKRHESRRSRSRSRSPRRDDSFLYPQTTSHYPVGTVYPPELGQQYAPPVHSEYPGSVPGYTYPQVPAYGGNFPDPYNYAVPQPAPIQNINPSPALTMVNPAPVHTMVNPAPVHTMMNPVAPPMVPAPSSQKADQTTPYDALAQLVAEGKISQEDYLKLTPNKGQATSLDTKTRVLVLTRCNQALSKLDKLLLPHQLMLRNQVLNTDDKYLAPKYCSPLKRQAVTEFNFSKTSATPDQQTKQLVESIVSTLGLDKVVSKYKSRLPKDKKHVMIQTTRTPCEICEIRESTKYHDVGTSTEPEYFTSTVHTQVVEQDLVNSKTVFNPSGSAGEGAPISIAHLTPAQLVSQLAARAKTLKHPQEPHPPPNQFNRRPPPNYDYDGRGGSQYQHPYNNYRY